MERQADHGPTAGAAGTRGRPSYARRRTDGAQPFHIDGQRLAQHLDHELHRMMIVILQNDDLYRRHAAPVCVSSSISGFVVTPALDKNGVWLMGPILAFAIDREYYTRYRLRTTRYTSSFRSNEVVIEAGWY